MSSKPRLGIVAVARAENGGSFQYTLETIEALHSLPEWDITLYCPADEKRYAQFGLPIQNLPTSKMRSILALFLDTFGIRSDPFKGNDALVAPMFSAHLLQTSAPFCYTLHDMQERYFPQYLSAGQRAWRACVHGRLTRRADRILCESEFVKSDIVRFYNTPSEKITVLAAPPQKEKDRSVSDPAEILKKYALPEIFLFYPAQFWPHKNHARLIEAFATIAPDFPEVKLVFTGHRRFSYEAVFRDIAARQLQDRVVHIGYIEDNDMPMLYRLATALVMPSLFESISIPIYEAFQFGTPVTASGILGMVEQIGDAGLTFDPLSTEGIAQAIRSLLVNKGLRATLAARGQKKIADMTTTRYATQLGAVLNDIIGSQGK